MEHLISSVEQWANDRNLIEGTTILHQYAKLIEEAGELGRAILRDDRAEMVDGIGDRRGTMVNGTFVKEEDHGS